jgi:hypothetical protein
LLSFDLQILMTWVVRWYLARNPHHQPMIQHSNNPAINYVILYLFCDCLHLFIILIIKTEGEKKKKTQIISLSSQIYANLVYKGILFSPVIWKLWSVFLRNRPLLADVCLNISIFIGVLFKGSLFYSLSLTGLYSFYSKLIFINNIFAETKLELIAVYQNVTI